MVGVATNVDDRPIGARDRSTVDGGAGPAARILDPSPYATNGATCATRRGAGVIGFDCGAGGAVLPIPAVSLGYIHVIRFREGKHAHLKLMFDRLLMRRRATGIVRVNAGTSALVHLIGRRPILLTASDGRQLCHACREECLCRLLSRRR